MSLATPVRLLFALFIGVELVSAQVAVPESGPDAKAKTVQDDLDWPTYRHDAERIGISPRDLPATLHLQWIHRSPQKPAGAWPGAAQSDWWRKRGTPEKKRVVFDMAYEVVGAGDRIFYGSSADDQLRCLDLNGGKVLWSFFAEAPIRLAPTVHGDLVLFGSDDGRVYAVDRRSGALRWKVALPEAENHRLPGNGRIMSLHPVRSGVHVKDGMASFCSGLFPQSEGAWLCTVDVRSGRLLDHKRIPASPQGYLEERDGKLNIPTGRDRAGAILATLRAAKERASKLGNSPAAYPFAFIGTPGQRVGGGDGMVALLSAEGGKELWRAEVKGKARSLAIVQGRLLVSTDEG